MLATYLRRFDLNGHALGDGEMVIPCGMARRVPHFEQKRGTANSA
jgi:hypothetical protein